MSKAKELIKEQEKTLKQEFDERDLIIIPTAKAFLKMITEYDQLQKDSDNDQQIKDLFAPLAKQILQYAVDNQLTRAQIGQSVNKIDRAFSALFGALINLSLNESQKLLEQKVFGKEIHELTLKEFDDILKK